MATEHETSWGVDDLSWEDLAPSLPAEVAALLAPPISVTTQRQWLTGPAEPAGLTGPAEIRGRHRLDGRRDQESDERVDPDRDADRQRDADDDRERWPAPGEPCGSTVANVTYPDRTPRFLAPQQLRSRSRLFSQRVRSL